MDVDVTGLPRVARERLLKHPSYVHRISNICRCFTKHVQLLSLFTKLWRIFLGIIRESFSVAELRSRRYTSFVVFFHRNKITFLSGHVTLRQRFPDVLHVTKLTALLTSHLVPGVFVKGTWIATNASWVAFRFLSCRWVSIDLFFLELIFFGKLNDPAFVTCNNASLHF